MDCPKCKDVELKDRDLGSGLTSYHCSTCSGDWLSGERYQMWQDTQEQPTSVNTTLQIETAYKPSDTDNRAAFCPECRRYLSRVKIPLETPFYLERCPECNGFWCDREEWDVLQQLSLDKSLEHIFTSEWQHQVRDQQHSVSERQALIGKLGNDLATEVFALGKKLAAERDGDYAEGTTLRDGVCALVWCA